MEACATKWLAELRSERRVIAVQVAGEQRLIAVEDAARYRDALGLALPSGLPAAFLEAPAGPLLDLVSRYARTHGPFRAEEVAARLGLGVGLVRAALARLAESGRVLEGEFLPGGRSREWCDADVLRTLKRQSLARLRRQVEPVEPRVLGRFLVEWQGVTQPRQGLDALLAVIEQLQGAPLPASALEAEILPARVSNYSPADLDTLCAAGEVLWRGFESLAPRDGRIALYLADKYPLLAPRIDPESNDLVEKVRQLLATRGAVFFSDLQAATGAFSEDLLAALWTLVWNGEVTNDTLAPLRALFSASEARRRRRSHARAFRSRRAGPPGSEGRWSLLPKVGLHESDSMSPTETERRTALTTQLLERYGVLTREAVHAEGIAGGFAAVYDVLKALEERGRVRRGYFVAGLGATQFALPGADDRLRALRHAPETSRTLVLAATDPANPYGAALPWPAERGEGRGARDEVQSPNPEVQAPRSEVQGPPYEVEVSGKSRSVSVAAASRPQRAAGAQVILHDGALLAWVPRTERNLLTFLPDAEPERSHAAAALAKALADLVDSGKRRAVLVTLVDGAPVVDSLLSRFLLEAGFTHGSRGFLKRRPHGGSINPLSRPAPE